MIEPAERELAEAPGLLDLFENRLDNLLPKTVATPTASPLSPHGHLTHQGRLRQRSTPGRIRLSVARLPWSEIGGDPPLLRRGQVRLIGNACIAQDLARLAPKISADDVDERHEGVSLGGVRHETVRYDHLMRGIDGDPPIVALYEPIAGWQDPAVRIGEVAPRPVRRSALLIT